MGCAMWFGLDKHNKKCWCRKQSHCRMVVLHPCLNSYQDGFVLLQLWGIHMLCLSFHEATAVTIMFPGMSCCFVFSVVVICCSWLSLLLHLLSAFLVLSLPSLLLLLLLLLLFASLLVLLSVAFLAVTAIIAAVICFFVGVVVSVVYWFHWQGYDLIMMREEEIMLQKLVFCCVHFYGSRYNHKQVKNKPFHFLWDPLTIVLWFHGL